MGALRLLFFRAGARRMALALDGVRAVLPAPLLEPPAGGPRFLEGFFDFRGGPVAAVRLDRLLDLDEDALGLYSPLILLAGQRDAIALHVARADDVASVAASAVQPIDKRDTFNGCVVGLVSMGGETAYVLRAESILLAAEHAAIRAHEATRARRLAALGEDERAA